jgi:hypothetical protein
MPHRRKILHDKLQAPKNEILAPQQKPTNCPPHSTTESPSSSQKRTPHQFQHPSGNLTRQTDTSGNLQPNQKGQKPTWEDAPKGANHQSKPNQDPAIPTKFCNPDQRSLPQSAQNSNPLLRAWRETKSAGVATKQANKMLCT